jgi:hypothetical protein
MEPASIQIDRDANLWTDRLRAYHVLIDGQDVGDIRRGESKIFEVSEGQDEVFLKDGRLRSKSIALDLDQGEKATLSCGARSPLMAFYFVTFGRKQYPRLQHGGSSTAERQT